MHLPGVLHIGTSGWHYDPWKGPQEPLRNLYGHVEVLADKLGPLLFQLPPNWRFNAERLAAFL